MIIAARFNGPPGSGNGGWTAGLLASHLREHLDTGAVEVTLRRPPPLETPLGLTTVDGVLEARDGEDLIATARPVELDAGPVPGVPFAEAVVASEGYPGFRAHPFPTCFVCGPGRTDGMGLFPGVLPDGRTATPWRVPGEVSEPLLWAALDCPGGWAVLTEGRPYVLGRITCRVDALPAPGDACVVTGVLIAEQGRKATVRTTVHSPAGTPLATATAIWVAVQGKGPG